MFVLLSNLGILPKGSRGREFMRFVQHGQFGFTAGNQVLRVVRFETGQKKIIPCKDDGDFLGSRYSMKNLQFALHEYYI